MFISRVEPQIIISQPLPKVEEPEKHLLPHEFNGTVLGWLGHYRKNQVLAFPCEYAFKRVHPDTYYIGSMHIPIFSDGGTILGIRKDTRKANGFGGFTEVGEHPSLTGKREIQEETGIEISGKVFFGGLYRDLDRHSLSFVYYSHELMTTSEALEKVSTNKEMDVEHSDYCTYAEGQSIMEHYPSIMVGDILGKEC